MSCLRDLWLVLHQYVLASLLGLLLCHSCSQWPVLLQPYYPTTSNPLWSNATYTLICMIFTAVFFERRKKNSLKWKKTAEDKRTEKGFSGIQLKFKNATQSVWWCVYTVQRHSIFFNSRALYHFDIQSLFILECIWGSIWCWQKTLKLKQWNQRKPSNCKTLYWWKKSIIMFHSLMLHAFCQRWHH